jgi:hypothetical protein
MKNHEKCPINRFRAFFMQLTHFSQLNGVKSVWERKTHGYFSGHVDRWQNQGDNLRNFTSVNLLDYFIFNFPTL